jgi:hypothetical protein
MNSFKALGGPSNVIVPSRDSVYRTFPAATANPKKIKIKQIKSHIKN